MDLTQLLGEAAKLGFIDPGLEAEYRRDRQERDSRQARRVLLVLVVVVVCIAFVVTTLNFLRGESELKPWMVIRFGVLAPCLLLMWFLAGTDWGGRNLQRMLGIGLPIALGAYGIEWATEWTPGSPLRGLWAVPLLSLWGCAMALPMTARSVAAATVGVCAITTSGVAQFVTGLDAAMITGVIIAYGLSGLGIIMFARWREADNRRAFVHRRQSRLLEEELRRQNESLVQANKLRDEFVEGVMHDIRSPLTAIFMSSTTLRDAREMSDRGRTELADAIVQGGKHIDTFVNRFLEQRSLDRADTPPAIVDMALDAAVDNVVTRARMTAVAKGQQIVVETFLPCATVRADELLLDRALGNLLDNAIKYSPIDSSITLRVATDPEVPGRARLSVSDQGPGISPEEMTRLFRAYSRLEKKTTGGETSVGLGLALVKKWIESMGGHVGCESEPSRGATFWISLTRK